MSASDLLDPDAMPAVLKAMWPRSLLPQSVVAGIDEDDCAIIRFGSELLVVTTDFVNANPIVIELGLGGLYELGRLLINASLSDLCGTGADPIALLTAVTLPRDSTRAEFLRLSEGIRDEALKYDVPVVGGDTKLGSCRALNATALGRAESEAHLFLKNRARAGQLLWVSGHIGECNAAVMLQALAGAPGKLAEKAKQAIASPTVPLAKSRALSQASLSCGGIDISDGLGADLARMCDASGVGATVDLERLPASSFLTEAAAQLGLPLWSFALACGGDCQFLVTTAEEHAKSVEALGFHLVGHITSDRALSAHLGNRASFALPTRGHRDADNLSFADEIAFLIRAATARTGINK
jgi:thiamine-monophosphate kinase